MIVRASILGVVIGAAYTLSPLAVVAALGFGLVFRWAAAVPDEAERRWLLALLAVGVGLRVLAVGGLFLSTDHQAVPFGWFFGDEEYFIRRSIWLRNLALGIPISLADVHYAYDNAIQTSFVWMLAALNVLFGPSPYALRLVSALTYVWGAVWLYRTVRPSFGLPASLAGLAALLFLPSLFMWSISVLKEPVFFAMLAGVVALTVAAARHPSWLVRAGALALIAVAAYVAETVRDGGLVVVAAGTAGGVLLGFAAIRPRLVAAAAIVALAVAPPVLLNARVQDAITAGVARAALRHWDHVHAPGHSYMLFDPAFYREPPVAGGMTRGDAVRLVTLGLTAYVVTPLPWQMQSRAELAYLPEQVMWYSLALLAPIGMVSAFRRDPFLAAVLLAHLVVGVALVALTSGNIGTLVRHRALAMPYIVWFGGLGLSVVLAGLSGAWQHPAAHPLVRQEAEA